MIDQQKTENDMLSNHDLSNRHDAHDQAAIMNAILAYPMDKIISRHMKDDCVTREQAVTHEQELKRYLAICALHPEDGFPMFPKVDGLWHAFVLHTSDYARFCAASAGRFIHHRPNDGAEDRGEIEVAYVRFKEYYARHFGAPPPTEFWPTTLKGASACNTSGDGCTQDSCGDSCTKCGVTCR